MQKQKTDIHSYWRTPDEVNRTESYLEVGIGRSLFLLQEMRRLASPKDRIMEIGCNAGRNLAFLWNGGFKKLSAVEISQPAVDLLRESFPALQSVPVTVAPVEDFLKEQPDDSVDVIFTVAVLVHLHWDSEFVFREMARVGKRIVLLEDEATVTERHFPRNYQEIFEGLGLTQIAHTPTVPDLPQQYVYRAFERPRLNEDRSVVGKSNPILELGIGTTSPSTPRDRLLEEKLFLVLDAVFRKDAGPHESPTAREVATRTGASIEFVQLVQRLAVANGWASHIVGDRVFPNMKDYEPDSRELVTAFADHLENRARPARAKKRPA